MKHTPGPWIVNSSAVKANWPSNALTICEVNIIPGKKPAISEQHGNLFLIAAAPDLLEALTNLTTIAADLIDLDDVGALEIINDAKAAIEKARCV